jgi:hypothetical protein
MADEGLNQPIGFTVEVPITKIEGKKASITVPGEIRLTPNLLSYINLALAERGLELTHMDITEEHRKELEHLPNVVVQDEKGE